MWFESIRPHANGLGIFRFGAIDYTIHISDITMFGGQYRNLLNCRSPSVSTFYFYFGRMRGQNHYVLLWFRATGNSRSETGKKFPRPVPKFPKIPVPKILQNKPQSNFQKCQFLQFCTFFADCILRDIKQQQLLFYNRTNHKQAKSGL